MGSTHDMKTSKGGMSCIHHGSFANNHNGDHELVNNTMVKRTFLGFSLFGLVFLSSLVVIDALSLSSARPKTDGEHLAAFGTFSLVNRIQSYARTFMTHSTTNPLLISQLNTT